jgi:hypothetical protein
LTTKAKHNQSHIVGERKRKDGKKMAREVVLAEVKGERPIDCNWVMKKGGLQQNTLVSLTNL